MVHTNSNSQTQKRGLVLEGGAMLGLFTCGVLDVLISNHVEVDGVVGVSAGACFGCNYKSSQAGRAICYNMEYCQDPRYCSVKSLLTTGDMYGAQFCYHEIPEKLNPFDYSAYAENPMKFYTVSTDLETGKAHYHLNKYCDYDDLEWMRASASMPLVSTPVAIGNRLFLDGGISDSIPLRFMEHKGYEKNVIILTKPRSYIKTKNSLLPLIRIMYRKYPAFIKACATRHMMYNKTREYIFAQEAAGKCFIICPDDTLPIGHISHSISEIQDVYDIGYEKGEAMLDALQAYLHS